VQASYNVCDFVIARGACAALEDRLLDEEGKARWKKTRDSALFAYTVGRYKVGKVGVVGIIALGRPLRH
jgi:hypothetical protein